MKRVLSLVTALVLLLMSLNISFAIAEETAAPISGSADTGVYRWILGAEDVSGKDTYTYTDEYASIRVGTASSDSITAEKGIYWSGASVLEPTSGNAPHSVSDSNRYVMVKPAYSGKLYITLAFVVASSSGKGRAWYYDYGEVNFDDSLIDLSKNRKYEGDYKIGQVQIGSDFTSSSAVTNSFDVTANHTYLIYTYNKGAYLSALYYTSDNIVGKTATPTINTPITAADTSISGTCAEGAAVSVKINGGVAQSATVEGTEWTLTGLTLTEGDTITVTAKRDSYNVSNALAAVVAADDSVCSLTINPSDNGTVTSNIESGKVNKGSEVTLTANANDGYRLKTLTVGGETVMVDTDNTYSFTINSDTEVSAEFEAIPYHNITVVQGSNGTITVADGAENNAGVLRGAEGDRVMLTVAPEKGYRIKSLTYKMGENAPVEFKYGAFFYMPNGDVTVTAEFKQEDTVSYVDTTLDTYDRLTLMVDGEPFFFNGVQVRPDNATDQLHFTDEQIKAMYLQAGADGYTVVNSQIRWKDVQPDTEIFASDTGHIVSGAKTAASESITAKTKDSESIAYITFNNLPEIDTNHSYAAVKLRLYGLSTADTTYTVYGVNADGTLDESFKVTSPDWDMASSTAAYHSVNVADYINAHKNDDSVTFAVISDKGELTISGSEDIRPPQLKLSRDDVYDWTYLDKILDYAHEAGVKFEVLWFATDTCQQSHELRVPYYVHENYQKCLRSDGTPARVLGATNNFIMCKNDLDLRAKEKEVLETVFDHIAEYTEQKNYGHLVIGCQVANETAVGRLHSGTDADKYFGHCYCDVCMERLANSKNETAYREDTLWEYLNNLSSAVKESKCSVWTRENNYMTTDTNVLAYNEQKRATTGTDLDFIGLDPYSVTGGADHDYIYSFGHESCTYKSHTYNYSQGKNLPVVMEYGGNNKDLDESTFTCIAGGAAMNVYELLSGKEDFGTYVADSSSAAGFKARTSYTYASGNSANWTNENFIGNVRNMNAMLNKVKYDLATKKADGAGGEKLVFFNPKFTSGQTDFDGAIRALNLTYTTQANSGGIAIEKIDKEIVLLSSGEADFTIEGLGEYTIASAESGAYNDSGEWVKSKDKTYTNENGDVTVSMDAYECVRLTTTDEIPAKPVITPVSGTAEEGKYTLDFGTPDEVSAKAIYDYSDNYVSLRTAIGSGDSITKENGLKWSAASCLESDSAYDNSRYMLVKPSYSGTVTIKFTIDKPSSTSANARGCLYLNDYGTETGFNSADLTKLKKDIGTKIGGDIKTADAQEQTFDVTAGHTYSLHTYNFPATITEIYLESEDITIDTPEPQVEDDMPVTLAALAKGADGKLTGSVVYNGEGDMQEVKLIAAVYDGDILDNIEVFNITSAGNIDFKGYTVDENKDLKLFVWNKLNDMTPMSRVYTKDDIE